jgi:hypothetical protein
LLVLLLSANTFLTFLLPVLGNDVVNPTSVPAPAVQNVEKDPESGYENNVNKVEGEKKVNSAESEKEVIGVPFGLSKPTSVYEERKDLPVEDLQDKQKLSPPDVIINDRKVIFKRYPQFDGTAWLFPLEEIAQVIQDKVEVNLTTKTITVTRFRDRAIVQLDVNSGIINLNNSPFMTLLGYEHIILGTEVQLVPANAIALLHNLSLRIDEDGNYIFKSVISSLSETQGTIQPQVKKGLTKISKDYLNATTSIEGSPVSDLYRRRLEVNSGGHNDDVSVTSNFVLKGGTGGDFFLTDTANVSYFKNGSPFQFTLGDMTLGTINSQFLSGVLLRGVSLQTGGGLKDSRTISGIGFLPSNNKINGDVESFFRFGRALQILEWSSSSKNKWQFSFGEALFKDTINNTFLNAKQSGGITTAKVVKTGKIVEGESNLSLSFADDKRYVPVEQKVDADTGETDKKPKSILVQDKKSGFGGDILIRVKPTKWFNIYGKTAYYGPGFYPVSSNLFYNDRNEITGGANFSFKKVNFGASESIGRIRLDADKPDKYKVINAFGTITPIKNGPSLSLNYSKNLSQINPDRSFFLFSNTKFANNPGAITLDELLERRTTSSFRLGLIQNWKKTNFSANYNQIKLNNESNIMTPLLDGNSSDTFKSYDFNVYRTISPRLALLNFSQFSDSFSQLNWGLRAGPIRKFDIQAQLGFLRPKDKDISPQYNINLRYLASKKMSINLVYDKSDFFTRIFALVRYNFIGDQTSGVPAVQSLSGFGKIRGRVYVREDVLVAKPGTNINPSTLGKGVPNIRIYFHGQEYQTDKNGYYEIPRVSKGVHKINIDFSDIPAYLAALSNESIDVQVENGKDTVYDFVLSHYGSANGKINLIGENPSVGSINYDSIPGIRVYLEGTDYEALTEDDGSFELSDVAPGKYKVLVDSDFLTEDLEVVNEDVYVSIRAKQKTENIILKIKYKARNTEEKEF